MLRMQDSQVDKMESSKKITIIEFEMMDKRKFFPLTVLSGFSIRCILYPVTLVKTRLQMQRGTELYTGTFNALSKILKSEGAMGLYRGFLISTLQIAPQVCYISTYEGVRTCLEKYGGVTNTKVKSMIGGMCASVVGQTFVVPVDVVSQYLMVLSKSTGHMPEHIRRSFPLSVDNMAYYSRWGFTKALCKALYKRDGIAGFYRGYLASLAVFAPNSAMWWYFYDTYCDVLSGVAPVWVPRLALQCISAPLGGITVSVITNPLDTIRTRIQVEGKTFSRTVRTLWAEEQMGMFMKGLSARMIQSVTFSFFIILGYESIKRVSLLEEHKDKVRW
ncbi:solute carrier family 25 member 44-like [Lineus longissimus]|uniref:solute carrier family 25 member 44-like n=1 Tax=Lineus longissimus TaxID=88925 RepID=UPI00315C9A50